MSDSYSTFFVGDVDESFCDERPRQRRHERVSSLIHCVSLEGRIDVVLCKCLLEVEDVGFHCSAVEGFGLRCLKVNVLLSYVGCHGDNIIALFCEPHNCNGSIKPSAVG